MSAVSGRVNLAKTFSGLLSTGRCVGRLQRQRLGESARRRRRGMKVISRRLGHGRRVDGRLAPADGSPANSGSNRCVRVGLRPIQAEAGEVMPSCVARLCGRCAAPRPAPPAPPRRLADQFFQPGAAHATRENSAATKKPWQPRWGCSASPGRSRRPSPRNWRAAAIHDDSPSRR